MRILRSPHLSLDFVRLAGRWPNRTRFAETLTALMPALVQATGILPPGHYSITVALTDDAHQKELNHQFRGIPRATNVLSFPAFSPRTLKRLQPGRKPVALGDISLAAEYVTGEARRDGKKLTNHIIHLVIHGVLHILGHDHQTERLAARMEQLERDLLARLHIADPYAASDAVMPVRQVAHRSPRTR